MKKCYFCNEPIKSSEFLNFLACLDKEEHILKEFIIHKSCKNKFNKDDEYKKYLKNPINVYYI